MISKLQMVKNLETIADDCAEDDISLVRIDDKEEAGQYGLKKLPALLFFNFQVEKKNNCFDILLKLNSQVPSLFTGDLSDTGDVYDWINR